MSVVPRQLLDFWFDPESTGHWFTRDDDFDRRIAERFGAATEAAAAGNLDDWSATPQGWLALLLLLDQFPRNLYRGDARAWAQDVSAQRVALSGLAQNHDSALPVVMRVFAYLPMEHAEDMRLQQRSVELFEALCREVPESERSRFEGFLDYARRHREVIERFGRFPHRNEILGRASTPEEQHYLAQPGSGF